jgi:hypothetical protein
MTDRDTSDTTVAPSGASGVEVLRARLSGVTEDLVAGRITASEANRITGEAARDLRMVEAALRVAKTARKLGAARR